MHPSCSQNNVKNSSCFSDKTTGRTRERFSFIVNSILIYLLYLRLDYTELYLFFVFQITVLCIGILIKDKQLFAAPLHSRNFFKMNKCTIVNSPSMAVQCAMIPNVELLITSSSICYFITFYLIN